MLKDVNTGRIRLPRDEEQFLKRKAAEQGYAINRIRTEEQALDANIKALPEHLARDMLDFFETGSSRYTKATSVEELEALWFAGRSEDRAGQNR